MFFVNWIDWVGVVVIYVGILLFVVVWFGFWFLKKSWFVCYEDMEIVLWIVVNCGV